ncbi:hypothetical protein H0253_18695 [Pectobacterium versatile]|uniref:Transposase n=1 Tax=Pectobacterium versatile TaxID=2488639 RepID=A0AAW3RWM7_9GAMM|nr:hypothetical protein [Pectobacterium versatile]
MPIKTKITTLNTNKSHINGIKTQQTHRFKRSLVFIQ